MALALLGLAATVASDAGTSGPGTPAFVDGRILVGFKSGTTAAQQRAATTSAQATLAATIGAGTQVLNVPKGQVASRIGKLKAFSQVAYAEPDYIVRPVDTTPNDPSFSQLWGMQKISAPKAWSTTTGSSAVVVGVVDTGVAYNHEDLAANVWSNPGGIGGCPAGTHGYNVVAGSCDPLDDNEHGSHVSGTIGGVGNNGKGVVGVNWTTRIMGLKFFDASGNGSIEGAIIAIDFAIAVKQAGVNVRVLSNSWGGGGFSQAFLDELNKAGANGMLAVFAAGNSGSNVDSAPFYPCSDKAANEICVAATDSADKLAGFSNYGQATVDLAAPGVGILSTELGNSYGVLSGTSMATPHVAGAAALALAASPGLSVSALKSTILGAVDSVSSLAGKVGTGGRLDVCKAIPGCGSAGAGDFTIRATPKKQTIKRGSSGAYTVTVTPTGGFSGAVALSVSGLPAAAGGSFSPTPVVISGAASSSTLTVTTSVLTPKGSSVLTITGTSGALSHSATATLKVRK